MFPPKDPEISSELNKTLRIYPFHHNSGGFFVALFEKIEDFDYVEPKELAEVRPAEEELKADELAKESQQPEELKQVEESKQGEKRPDYFNPVCFEEKFPEDWEHIKAFYGLSDPEKILANRLIIDQDSRRRIYYVNNPIRKLIADNMLKKANRIGMKVFQISPDIGDLCKYRLLQEACPLFHDKVTKQAVNVDVEEFTELLTKSPIKLEAMAQKLKDKISELKTGPILIRSSLSLERIPLCFMAWKGIGQISDLSSKEDKALLSTYLEYVSRV
eukprot:TRINITY_DN2633_c0_g2_i3.p1 TRINITY_DN2633_c0_g2~~TRINITY_DN2633_c0_g2_i3.p1  ORF type:complete len:274 (+),score=29.01 TRINITY_DN2633_c0_g2_i3:1171-1992(+)